MIPQKLQNLGLSLIKLSLFIVLFIDFTQYFSQHQLKDMAAPFEIHEPSQEQMEARLAEWKSKLEGKYVALETPLDEQLRERFPSLNLQTLPEDAKPVSYDDKWHYKINEVDLVKPSEIKYEVRHLWPGRPATRDLRFDRMNLHTDNEGKIDRVTFG